jgi:hypothetical protein
LPRSAEAELTEKVNSPQAVEKACISQQRTDFFAVLLFLLKLKTEKV